MKPVGVAFVVIIMNGTSVFYRKGGALCIAHSSRVCRRQTYIRTLPFELPQIQTVCSTSSHALWRPSHFMLLALVRM